MTLLNQASDGLSTVLISLVRSVVRFGPRAREDLLQICGGDTPLVESGMLSNTLNRWLELGLFELADGKIGLTQAARAGLGKDPHTAEARLPAIALSVALAAANNERFWEKEAAKSADFSRGAAWMLAQDVYATDTSTEGLQALETAQFPRQTSTIVQNNTRWNGLRTWMGYLGLGRVASPWSIDPSVALRAELPEIFAKDRRLSATEFIERAANRLPVLDGGAYRQQVEAVLKDNQWSPPREGSLSTSLSRALQRLDREGSITIEHQSDADDALSLMGQGQRIWREMTHVILPAGNATK